MLSEALNELLRSTPETARAFDWTCHALVPIRLLIYAALLSNAKGLFQPNAECLRRGL